MTLARIALGESTSAFLQAAANYAANHDNSPAASAESAGAYARQRFKAHPTFAARLNLLHVTSDL
jgi:hypothetical protein